MSYKAVPFDPGVGRADSVGDTALRLAELINAESGSGWEFVELSNHSTIVPGDAGCFGIGATAPYPKTVSVAVFRQ